MLKKIALVVSLLCIVAFSAPAMAQMPYGNSDFLEQEQFGVNLLMTGLVINPVDIGVSEYENRPCGRVEGFDLGLYWGGLTIDILAVQAISQHQSINIPGRGGFAMGCQKYNNSLSVVSDGLTIKMTQDGSQFGIGYSSSKRYNDCY